MSEEDQDKRELATNRLLDLLRSQQAGVPEEVPVEVVTPEDEPEPSQEAKPVIEEKPAAGEVPPEEKPQEKEENVSAKSLLDALHAVQTREDEEEPPPATETGPAVTEEAKAVEPEEATEEITPEKKEAETATETPPLSKALFDELKSPAKPAVEKVTPPAEEVETPAPRKILDEIQVPKPQPEPQTEPVIPPAEFDSTLLAPNIAHQRKETLQSFVRGIYHFINESQDRVAIYEGENFLRVLHVKLSLNKNIVRKFGDYTLPYEADGRTITDKENLWQYIFTKELDAKNLKRSYGAFYTSSIETKTHIFQTPPLKKKELHDLIEWNAKKNIPFSPDSAIMNWEVSSTAGKGGKRNVVIGISEQNGVEETLAKFKKTKVKPRLFTTLAILLWKSFLANYPDRKRGCYIVAYMGEDYTSLVVVQDQQLLFNREITIGTEDFYKAAMQKVVSPQKTITIDYPLAKRILHNYGIPQATDGVTVDDYISLYKISIFLRPVVERLTSELSRSLNFFKKQNPELEWQELFFSGSGAMFPNLLHTLAENIDLKVSLLNPMRCKMYTFQDGQVLPEVNVPQYALNFALTNEEAESINIIPDNLRTNYRFIFLNKTAAFLVALFIPIFIATTWFSSVKVKRLDVLVQQKNTLWSKLSTQAKDYLGRKKDLKILEDYRILLQNDRTYSLNQIKLLKLFSNTVPSAIHLTSLRFNKVIASSDENAAEDTKNQKVTDVLEVAGFVQADASVADIQLTNFVMKLEQFDFLHKVVTSMEETSDAEDGKLFFNLKLQF